MSLLCSKFGRYMGAAGARAACTKMRGFASFGESLAEQMKLVRAQKPLVQCITNYVSMDIMANVLCAADMSPAMAHGGKCGEAAEFAAIAGAVNINLGTLDEDWAQGALETAKVCGEKGTPWVIDPVGVGFLSYRTGIIKKLLQMQPTVLRGNPSECITCARLFPDLEHLGSTRSGGSAEAKGVDSAVGTEAVNLMLIDELAKKIGGVVCMTGKHDYVTDGGENKFSVQHNVPELQDVIATGCALGSVVSGFAAVEKGSAAASGVTPNYAKSTAHAVAYFTLAAELARDNPRYSAGPGSLRTGLMDLLKTLSDTQMRELAKIEKVA